MKEKQVKEKEATQSAVIEGQGRVDEEGDVDDIFVHPWSNPLKKNTPWDPDPSKVDLFCLVARLLVTRRTTSPVMIMSLETFAKRSCLVPQWLAYYLIFFR